MLHQLGLWKHRVNALGFSAPQLVRFFCLSTVLVGSVSGGKCCSFGLAINSQDAWSVTRVEDRVSIYSVYDGHGPYGCLVNVWDHESMIFHLNTAVGSGDEEEAYAMNGIDMNTKWFWYDDEHEWTRTWIMKMMKMKIMSMLVKRAKATLDRGLRYGLACKSIGQKIQGNQS